MDRILQDNNGSQEDKSGVREQVNTVDSYFEKSLSQELRKLQLYSIDNFLERREVR